MSKEVCCQKSNPGATEEQNGNSQPHLNTLINNRLQWTMRTSEPSARAEITQQKSNEKITLATRPRLRGKRIHGSHALWACIHLSLASAVLVESYDRDLVVNVFRSGARGLFCSAETPFRSLCKCIHCVHAGQVWANSKQLRYLLEIIHHVPSLRVVSSSGDELLTTREEQVVALVAGWPQQPRDCASTRTQRTHDQEVSFSRI